MRDLAIADALKHVRVTLLAHNKCLITDRPDLPISDETSWTTDFDVHLEILDVVIGLMNSNPQSLNESSARQIAQIEALSKHSQGRRSSHSPDSDHL